MEVRWGLEFVYVWLTFAFVAASRAHGCESGRGLQALTHQVCGCIRRMIEGGVSRSNPAFDKNPFLKLQCQYPIFCAELDRRVCFQAFLVGTDM